MSYLPDHLLKAGSIGAKVKVTIVTGLLAKGDMDVNSGQID
jgi:hypothetical protein